MEKARQFGVPLPASDKARAVDPNVQVIRTPRKFTAAHWIFIIGTDGGILHRDTGGSPLYDSLAVLEVLQNLNAE